MSRQIVNTNIRFNLDKEPDRMAWKYLQHRDKQQHRSYSRAVIAAVNAFFEHRGRLDADPYLETREKEDAFLLRVLETIRAGLNQSATQADQQEANDMVTLSGKRFVHLLATENAVHNLLDSMMPGMAKEAGATEELKAHAPMRGVGLINCCKAQVEEIIYAELIFI